MKKLTFLLLISAFALMAEDEPTPGHYELQPLAWKGNFTLTLTGFLPLAGLNEVIKNQVIGLYNNLNDICVGMKVIPVKRNGNYVFRDEYSEFVYGISTAKFTYNDRYAEDWISILTFNEDDDMYYSNDLANKIGKIKGQGKLFDPVMPAFNDNYAMTLYNSDEEKPFCVSDSMVTMQPAGQNFAFTGETYPGTKIKVTVKKKTGKVNFKMKVKKDANTTDYSSVVPSLCWFVEDPPLEDKE
ncbi:hypothetical protein J6X96_02400 [bacterium]|nr:hypothetical protein [bacterium]